MVALSMNEGAAAAIDDPMCFQCQPLASPKWSAVRITTRVVVDGRRRFYDPNASLRATREVMRPHWLRETQRLMIRNKCCFQLVEIDVLNRHGRRCGESGGSTSRVSNNHELRLHSYGCQRDMCCGT